MHLVIINVFIFSASFIFCLGPDDEHQTSAVYRDRVFDLLHQFVSGQPDPPAQPLASKM